MSNPEFKEIANRDAWHTIRGFVYQVNYTILRWVKLTESEALELERGEDIDTIGREIQNNASRVLEQLKYRESTISLNQISTLEILRNFYQHKVNNPGLNLYFRYVTNAGYNIERPAFFIDGRKGIDVWKELANLPSLEGTNKDLKTIKRNLLKRINEHTVKADKHNTEGIESDTWQTFAEYIEDDSLLIEFIKSFEWSSDNLNHKQVSESIVLALEQQYPEKHGKVIYERLFLYVFKLLCSPGLKRLEKCHLNEQCELPELGAADKQLSSLINNTLGEFHTKLKGIEDAVTNQSKELNQLFQIVTNLKSDTVFDLKLGNLPISPPNLIANGTPRTTKVNELLGFFEYHRWIAFQGVIGTGKSQLAALVSRQFSHSFWLDMRDVNNDPTKAQLLLESFLSHVTSQPRMPDRTIWLRNVFAAFPASTIVVLNDLPEIGIDSFALQQLLAGIGSALEDTNVNLITTSNHGLPVTVYETVREGLVKEYKEFDFTNEEIAECLVSQNAPDNFLKSIRMIAAKTQRNPRLTFSIIRYLKSLNWVLDRQQLFSVVFGQDFSSDVLIDAQRSITKYIADDKTKELLYRLSLIDWDFSFKEVEAISSVEEIIKFPSERLQQLINIWIQQLNNQKFQVSPIINNIGERNLPDTTVRKIHEAFGDSLISNGTVNQMTAQRAIIAFTRAGKYNRAGHLLFNFYLSANTKEEIESLDRWGYLSFWSNSPLPIEMDLPLRALIKLQQLRLNRRLGRKTDSFASIVEYLNSPDFPDLEAVIIKMMLLVQHYDDLSLAVFWDYLDFVLQKWTWFSSKAPELVDLPSLSTLLWVPLNRLIEEDDIRKWLHLAKMMEIDLGEDAFTHEVASNVVAILCTEITSSNSPDFDDEISLESQKSRLRLLLDFFKQSNHELLEAIVFREIVNLQFNLSGNLEELKEAVSEVLGRINNQVGKFILTSYLGRTLLRRDELNDAREWLTNALDYNCKNEISYTDTLINTAAAFAVTDPEKSIGYCEEAVQISSSRSTFLLYEHLQTLAETGVAYWLFGDYSKAFSTYEILVDKLYYIKRDVNDPEWIRIFSLTGHATGFMASMLMTGKPPKKDGEGYFTPFIGMFFGNQKDFSTLYRPSNDALIAAQMAFFADGLNMPKKAYEWSLKAFDFARTGKNDSSFLMICSTCSQYAIVNFKPTEAFESNLLFAAVSSHLDTGTMGNKYDRLKDLDLGELLKVRPSEKWVTAENTTVLMTILPLFIQAMYAELEGSTERREWKEQFLTTLKDYIPNASDKLLWDLILELTTKILNNKISIKELIHQANTFNEQGRKELQILCILGVTFSTKDDAESIVSLINTIPYLQKAFGPIGSIGKYVLVPFVKDRVIHAIRNMFIGARSELQLLLDGIDGVDISDEHALRKFLRPAADLLEVNIPEDRQRWLYDFEEI